MNVKGIIWVGSMADDLDATTRFFSEVLAMPVITDVEGFTRLTAENGDRRELFGPGSVEHPVLDAGPVAGFWVDSAADAREELMAAGVDHVTELETGPDGHSWFYFRAPNGNYFEMCEHPAPRQPKGGR